MAVEPAFHWAPAYSQTFGPEVVDLAESVGLFLDADQSALLDDWFAVERSGRWVTTENGVACSRQNVKTISFEAAALGCLFLFDDDLIVWTAHEFPTTQEAFRDLHGYVENYDHLRRRVKTVHTANGSEGIELMNGHRLNFRARTARSGRGLTGKKMFLDEAQELLPAHMGSLVPTLSAVHNAQLFYAGSAGKITAAVWRSIRDRGRAGNEGRFSYREWCAPVTSCGSEHCTHALGSEGCALDNEDLWALANPALDRRITREFIRETERRSLPPAEFARERLGWWEDPPIGGGVFDENQWASLADPDSTVPGVPSFGLDVTPDRAWTTVAVSGRRADGLVHAGIVRHAKGTSWAVEECKELAKHGTVAVQAGSPAASLIPDLEDAGVPLELVSTAEYVAACGQFYDTVIEERLRYLPDSALDAAVAGAVQSPAGDAWKWNRKGLTDISPLVAVTLAASISAESIYEERDLLVLG